MGGPPGEAGMDGRVAGISGGQHAQSCKPDQSRRLQIKRWPYADALCNQGWRGSAGQKLKALPKKAEVGGWFKL